MSKFEKVRHYLANEGMADRKMPLEEVKDYVKTFTDESLWAGYTEDDFVVEWLKENILQALDNTCFPEAKFYAIALGDNYKDY